MEIDFLKLIPLVILLAFSLNLIGKHSIMALFVLMLVCNWYTIIDVLMIILILGVGREDEMMA